MLAGGTVNFGAKVFFQLGADHSVREVESVERTRIQCRTNNARATLIDVTGDHQPLTASRGKRANFSRIVSFAVFVRGADCHCAAGCLKCSLKRVGQTLAVVVVGIGDGDFGDALLHQHFGHHDALARIRWRCSEKQAIVFDR